MEKFLYIVNPVAGKGRGRKAIPIIENYCKGLNSQFTIIATEYPKHAKNIVENNLSQFNTVISVGGDGTLNEIVNGFDLGAETKLAVLPIGSGNDFVKNLGLYKTLTDNISLIHKANDSNIIYSDIGIINYSSNKGNEIISHRFINSLGIGFDAYVGYIHQNNKYLSGIMSYLYAVLKGLTKFKMISTEIKMDNYLINGDRLMVSIGNGVSSGGGFYLNPNAVIDDGQLDISIFDTVTRRRLLWALPMALFNKLERVPEAKLFRTNNSIEIKLRNPYYVHCDGEIITDTLKSAVISIKKNAIRIIKKAN